MIECMSQLKLQSGHRIHFFSFACKKLHIWMFPPDGALVKKSEQLDHQSGVHVFLSISLICKVLYKSTCFLKKWYLHAIFACIYLVHIVNPIEELEYSIKFGEIHPLLGPSSCANCLYLAP